MLFSMKKNLCIIISLLLLSLISSSERVKPLDIYILVDKSLSMGESGAFTDAQQWLTGTFIDDSLIIGDTVNLYFFFGETKKVYTKTIVSEADFVELKRIVSQSKADGAFTDIGLALDTVKETVTGRQTDSAVFILTDLIQEASYGSKYAGTYYDFAQRYMTEDRIIPHKINGKDTSWFEITVQAGNLKAIEERAQRIYNTIRNTTKEPLYVAQNRTL